MLLVIGILWVAFSIVVTGFLAEPTFESIFGRSVANGLIATGFTICLLSGQIDLSVGSTFALTGVVLALLQPAIGSLGASVVGVSVGIGVGAINGLLVAGLRVNSFIASLGTLLLARGLAFIVAGGRPVNGSDLTAALWMNESFAGPISPRVTILLVVVVTLHLFVTRLRTGRELVAVGGQQEAAKAAGIPAYRRIALGFLVSGFTAGIAGVVSATSLLSGSPIVGETNLLAVVAAVFLGGAALTGGRGSVLASALAIVALSTLATGMELSFVHKAWQGMATGLLVIVASTPYVGRAARRSTLPRAVRNIVRRRTGTPAPGTGQGRDALS